MIQLPDLRNWRPEIDPEVAERQVRRLRELIADADRSIEEQQRIIANYGPLEVHMLSLEGLRQSQARLEGDLAEIMREREIEVLDFALDGPRYANHRAQAKPLSVFLDAMQKLYERVGQALVMPNPGMKIPLNIRQQCLLEVAGFFPSSFGIRFTTQTRVDLAGDSLADAALEATFELVNTDQPIEHIERLGQRTMVQYRHLITTLIAAEATPKVQWRTPSGDERSWISNENALLSLSNRLANLRELAPRILQASGVLTGASLRRQKFELAGDQGIVTGKAPRELAEKVTQNFGKPCRITYVETLYLDEGTDQEKRSRTLMDIEAI
ncbi:MAG: hypothetical protein MUC53_10795 [Candidatus Contendobacter sp.]|jgi:hypothetical protein|nr:hypothetical protein [Candidatus Contendobacter sp.]